MSSWQTKKIGDILTIRHGRNQKEVEDSKGAYPILGTGGQIGRTNSYLYDKPSVLIGRKGTIDKPRYMYTPFWTVDTLFYSEIHSNTVPKFAFYIFNTINWYRYNEASGVPSLSASSISNIKVNVPGKPEQEQIVSVLEVWDEYLEKFEQKISMKKELKKGLMQQLLTGNRRIKGYSQDWKEYHIGEILEILTDYTANGSFASLKESVQYFSDPQYSALVRTTDLEKKIFAPVRFTNKRGYEYLKKTSLYGGELIMSNVGNIGKIYRVPKYAGLMTLAPNTYLIKFCEELIDKNFIYQKMLTYSFKRSVLKMVGGGEGGGLVAINKANFKSIKLHIPIELKEQNEIAKSLETLDLEVQLLESKRDIVKMQRKYLLKNLITGTIRTPETLIRKEIA